MVSHPLDHPYVYRRLGPQLGVPYRGPPRAEDKLGDSQIFAVFGLGRQPVRSKRELVTHGLVAPGRVAVGVEPVAGWWFLWGMANHRG